MKLDDLIKDYKEMTLDEVYVEDLLEDLHKLKDTYTSEVPEYVANWYEKHKDDLEFNIWDWIAFRDEPKKTENKKFNVWLNEGLNTPIQTLVKMHLFGYKVKKEKKYIIKLKNVQKGSESFKFDRVIEKWYFGFNQESSTARLYHTKEELRKAGFEWMFSCPGLEIEEIEEVE